LQRKTINRSPSAPELTQNRIHPTVDSSKHLVARSDSQLDDATTQRRNITCIPGDDFRKVLTSSIGMGHPRWEDLDTDEFCKALFGKLSELALKLLIMVALAYALVGANARRYIGQH
jgi:hypothetical protein